MNNRLIALRNELHAMPEPALREIRTKATLMAWIRENTALTPIDMGAWFYCRSDGELPAIALRADFDAVETDGACAHICGHDGHAAILCGVAAALPARRAVYLIFQPAEETGQGARMIAPFLEEEGIAEVYGLHNIPGYATGSVLIRHRTFACASTGLEITLNGAPAHAAYPDTGRNPAYVIAELIRLSRSLTEGRHRGILLATVIGADIGGTAYGMSADRGVLRLTVRGEYREEFETLLAGLRNAAETLAAEYGLTCAMREIERFPGTENTPVCAEKVESVARALGFPVVYPDEPLRWSEDFGAYLERVPGAFFGIGAGEDTAQLHTKDYVFPDTIIDDAVRMFMGLCK